MSSSSYWWAVGSYVKKMAVGTDDFSKLRDAISGIEGIEEGTHLVMPLLCPIVATKRKSPWPRKKTTSRWVQNKGAWRAKALQVSRLEKRSHTWLVRPAPIVLWSNIYYIARYFQVQSKESEFISSRKTQCCPMMRILCNKFCVLVQKFCNNWSIACWWFE